MLAPKLALYLPHLSIGPQLQTGFSHHSSAELIPLRVGQRCIPGFAVIRSSAKIRHGDASLGEKLGLGEYHLSI